VVPTQSTAAGSHWVQRPLVQAPDLQSLAVSHASPRAALTLVGAPPSPALPWLAAPWLALLSLELVAPPELPSAPAPPVPPVRVPLLVFVELVSPVLPVVLVPPAPPFSLSLQVHLLSQLVKRSPEQPPSS
jgi:hypothetical protein